MLNQTGRIGKLFLVELTIYKLSRRLRDNLCWRIIFLTGRIPTITGEISKYYNRISCLRAWTPVVFAMETKPIGSTGNGWTSRAERRFSCSI